MEDPILAPSLARFTTFPVRYSDRWDLYKKAVGSFWTVEEIDLAGDLKDWDKLSSDEQHFINMVLAFFASSDGIVIHDAQVGKELQQSSLTGVLCAKRSRTFICTRTKRKPVDGRKDHLVYPRDLSQLSTFFLLLAGLKTEFTPLSFCFHPSLLRRIKVDVGIFEALGFFTFLTLDRFSELTPVCVMRLFEKMA